MDPFIGQIQPFGFNFAPRGWAFCDGQLLAISSNTALFSLIGTTFGGDGRTTFALPDLRGRSIVHVGHGPGLDTINWGERGGSYYKVLTPGEMPSHNHIATLHGESAVATSKNPQSNLLATPPTSGDDSNAIYATPNPAANKPMAPDAIVVSNAGGGQAFNTRNPYLGIYVSIALVGIFPSRS